MKHVIGKHQVNHCIYIGGQPKILTIVASKCHLHIGKHFDSIRNEYPSFFFPIGEKSFPCVVGGPHQNWRHWVSKDRESISQAQQCEKYVDINKHSFIPFPMSKKKRKNQVHVCIYVCMYVRMYICIREAFNLQPMMCVHHGSHPIKAETIKLVLLHPPPQIGEQKSQYLQKKFTSAINK
jgi:hypothetical protein